VITQIYGITTPDDAALVCELGADHIGIVLDEEIDTWDKVDLHTARAILAVIRWPTKVVALSLSTDLDRIAKTVEQTQPRIVHLARAADSMHPETVQRLRERLSPVEIMTTVPVRGRHAIEVARRFVPCSDYLLLDTAHPATGVVGATGHTHDWSLSAALVAAVERPVILAGGLGPENVLEAIERVRPAGVDSETRTSRADDRRRKDPDRVRRFIETAKKHGTIGR
jgi:phosphoribosylanthranilate isomerase